MYTLISIFNLLLLLLSYNVEEENKNMKYRWLLVTLPAYNQPFGIVLVKSHRWFPSLARCARNARKYYKNVKIDNQEQKVLFAIETKDGYHKAVENMQSRPKN